MTISGTELYEWGSYVVYKLDLQNRASNDMKLTSVPTVDITTSDAEGQTTLKDRIEVNLYSDANCTKPLEVQSTETDSSNANWLAKATTGEAGGSNKDGGTTSWYVKVHYKQYSKNASPEWKLEDGTFTFTVVPVWDAA